MADHKIKSWNRFLTRQFAIEPILLGAIHTFEHESAKVVVRLPAKDQVDRGIGFDEVANVVAYRTADDVPTKIKIMKVDVEISQSESLDLPDAVFQRHCNAFDLFSEEEQKNLDQTSFNYGRIAQFAFERWIRVVRWACNDHRIGSHQLMGNDSGWGTYLLDLETDHRVWVSPGIFSVEGSRCVSKEEWEHAQTLLNTSNDPPIYLEYKHEGERQFDHSDFRRAILDFAIACETFMRSQVLNRCPSNLNDKLSNFIEDANIAQYINNFFPEVLTEDRRLKFKKIKSELHKLFSTRNKIMHSGLKDGIDRQLCQRFLKATEQLFKLEPE